jgi:hypothetical protein
MSKEEEKTMLKILTDKIDELNKTINEEKIYSEEKMKENPLAYAVGAFIGGLIAGFLIGNEKNKERRRNRFRSRIRWSMD